MRMINSVCATGLLGNLIEETLVKIYFNLQNCRTMMMSPPQDCCLLEDSQAPCLRHLCTFHNTRFIVDIYSVELCNNDMSDRASFLGKSLGQKNAGKVK